MDVASVKTAILSIVDANGGRVPYQTVLDGLNYGERRFMIRALRELKSEGIAQKQNRVVDGKPVFEVFRLPATPTPTS